MKRSELAARLLVGALILAAAGTPLWLWSRTPLIHARAAENGGWTPGTLMATVGQPLRLRLTSDDVVHGFAVGQMDMQSVDVQPGKVTDVVLTFQKPGTYTFYCTRWCGLNHWRMRGTIEVSGGQPDTGSAARPLYAALGLDLDASHDSPLAPRTQPSALDGQELAASSGLSEFTDVDFYRSHSPYEVWEDLRGNTLRADLNDQQLWNMVAFVWQVNTTPEGIATGRRLFAQNCAACHGESGKGDGVFADQLAQAGASAGSHTASAPRASSGMLQRPANLADPRRMLGASPALLEGKILRGGMGTGMPSWGPLFKEAELWDIVSYIYTFQFKEFTK